MPPKKNRVSSTLFKELLQNAKHFSTYSLSFLYKKGGGEYKFSVVVPKKVQKKAAKRNRIKRIVREIIKKELTEQNINNLHFVVFVKQKVNFDKLNDFKSAILRDFKYFLTKV